MIINTLPLEKDHWSTDWIPISYNKFINVRVKKKSFTFLWEQDYKVLALCRVIYFSPKRIEISDLWLNPECRGKRREGVKLSTLFLRKVIRKIWSLFPKATKIGLIVDNQNFPAIKLYKSLNFRPSKRFPKGSEKYFSFDGIYMTRKKRGT